MKQTTANLNLKKFVFPEPDDKYLTLKADKSLLTEAKLRGFENPKHPYCLLFSSLFFNGGEVVFKKNLDLNFKQKAWPYCRALMMSWNPKHEHKEAICSMLLSELVELPNDLKQKHE